MLARWGLLFGSERQTAFLAFLREASLQPVNDVLFKQYLKISYAEAEQQLGNYLPEAIEDERRIELPATSGPTLTLREANPTEVARILGAWARLEAKVLPILQMDYRDECIARADRLFQREYRKEVHDPRFLAEFGLYALQQSDETKARAALEEATARGTVRPRAYVELARLHLAAALPSSPRGVGDLAPVEFERITTLLKTAREQMPSFALTYRVWAEVLEHAPERLPEDQLALLVQGVSLFPQNAALAVRVAKVYQAHGYKKKAQEVITGARGRAITPEARRVLAGFTGE